MSVFLRISGKSAARRTQPSEATVQKIVENVTSNVEKNTEQATRRPGKTFGELWDYAKVYYGVDVKAQPTVERSADIIKKMYPCKDGGKVIVQYVKRADGSSSLDVYKAGGNEVNTLGDWYRRFYSDMAVNNYKNQFKENATEIVRTKGATKQILSTQNGRATEDVHVPLKRWVRIFDRSRLDSGKKVENNINPWNPKDFDRFPKHI